MRIESQNNPLQTVTRYMESGKSVISHPNFIRLLTPGKISYDTLSAKQWALNKTG